MQIGKYRQKESEFFLKRSVIEHTIQKKRGDLYVGFHSRFTVCCKIALETNIVGDFDDRRNNLCTNQ